MRGLGWSVIAPTSRIAPLCHSILRLEPYTTCSLGCAYCYARWYRGPHGEPRSLARYGERLLRAVARAQEALGARLPVRMATLSDPFQPAEARLRASLRLLSLASRLEVPVILNTRVPPPGRRYMELIRDMAGSGLLLLQVTVTGSQEEWSLLRRLEPGSPPPRDRILLVEAASSLGVPVVARLQPYIPGVTGRSLERLLGELASAGARGVLLEFLRAEAGLVETLGSLAPERGVGWMEYAPGSGVLHPSPLYRLREAARVMAEARGRGLAFQTCKEGLFHLHRPLWADCCLLEPLLPAGIARKPTLQDVYQAVLQRGPLPPVEALMEACRLLRARRVAPLCHGETEALPRWLRAPLRLHLERTLRVLSRHGLLTRVAPALELRDGLVRAVPPWPGR